MPITFIYTQSSCACINNFDRCSSDTGVLALSHVSWFDVEPEYDQWVVTREKQTPTERSGKMIDSGSKQRHGETSRKAGALQLSQ